MASHSESDFNQTPGLNNDVIEETQKCTKFWIYFELQKNFIPLFERFYIDKIYLQNVYFVRYKMKL